MTIEQVCSRIIDYRGKTPTKATSGVRLITAKVVKGGEVRDEPAEFIPEDYYDEWMRRGLPQQWDVLVTTEAPLGETAILRTADRVALGQRLILLRGDPAIIDQRYLLYQLQSATVQARLAARATGTTVLGIKQSELRQVRLPVPSLDVQRRIGSILGTYDDLIDVNRQRIALLEEMVRGLFEEWFVRFRFPGHEGHAMIETPDGLMPEGWRLERVGNLTMDVRDTVHPSEVEGTTPYVGLEHIPRRSITLNDWGRADEVMSTKLRFRRGDVLFGKIRPYFHKVVWAPVEGVSSSDAIVIRSTTPGVAGLVLATVSSDRFVAHSVQTSNGTKMPRANWSVLAKYPVPFPAENLCKQFNDTIMEWVNLAATLQSANLRLSASRNLLLPRLTSGELSIAAAEAELEAAA